MLIVDKALSRFTLAAGEPFLFDVQFADDRGVVIGLDGRAFVLTIHDDHRHVVAVIDGAPGVDASGPFVRFARDGAFSEMLYAHVGLRIELAERYRGGREVISPGALWITASAASVASLDDAPIGQRVTRAAVRAAEKQGSGAPIEAVVTTVSLKVLGAPTPTPAPPSTEAGFWPYAPRSVPGRFVNQGNAQVAAGSSFVGEYGGSHLRFTAPPWATGRFKLVYANFSLLGNTATVGGNSYAGEIPCGAGMLEQVAINGTAVPFGGAASRNVAAGEVFVSDAVDMAAYGMTAGQGFFVDTFDYRQAGTLRPGGYRLYAAKGEGYAYGTTSRIGQDLTGTTATVSNWGPLTILWEGKPAGAKSAVLFGDSIGMGVASVIGVDYGLLGEQGYIERAMAAKGLGFVNLTKDGATAQHTGGPPINFANGSFAGRGAVIDLLKAQVTSSATLEAWNELVTNDITATLPISQNRVSVILQRLAEHGIRAKQISSVMDTNSSDGWTTVAGQSDKTAARNVNDRGGVAAGMEAWFAGGADGQVAAYYNARPLFAVEASGANANRWKPMAGGVAPTSDGLHPIYAKHVEAGDALAADTAFAAFIGS